MAHHSTEVRTHYLAAVRRTVAQHALRIAPLVVVLGAAIALRPRHVAFVWITGITLAVLAIVLLVAAGALAGLMRPVLVPYFSEPVDGAHTLSGRRLLRQSRELDRLAAPAGVRPIGSFVSPDDFFDRAPVAWHSAADALATVSALLDRSGDHPAVRVAAADLTVLRHRLAGAASRGVKFCFLLRTVPGTNALEWEQRAGKP